MPRLEPRHEPHKIKTVRLTSFPTLEARKRALAAAQFNVFHLTPSQVSFDMCARGASAMTQEQRSGLLLGDEAYAGAKNFEHLTEAVNRVLGHTYVCPVHNVLGAIKLVCATLLPAGSALPTNARAHADAFAPRGYELVDVRDSGAEGFTGNVDVAKLKEVLRQGKAPVVALQTYADGRHPFSYENLQAVREAADRAGARLLMDASRIVENAWYIQQHERGMKGRSVAELVRLLAKTAHDVMFDGALDARCDTGGVLTTDNPRDHEHFINEVVVYEGLHTYGGMAGRTMEVLARGLEEMCDESEVQWVMHQTELFTEKLRAAGVPLEAGCDGAYLLADRFLPHVEVWAQHALSSALYVSSGIRAVARGLVRRESVVPVQIPRLSMTTRQLECVAEAIIELYQHREKVSALELSEESRWHDELRFKGIFADLPQYEWETYNFLIHTVERVAELTRDQRLKAIQEAGWNTFLLRSADTTIDLLTDSGTSAMSTEQWAEYEAAQCSPCATDAWRRFVDVARRTYGYEHILPTHQGRAAEHVLSQALIKPGQLVPGNMYFTTTREHQELAGGIFVDVIVDEAHDPTSDYPWKGDIDLNKVKALVDQRGPEGIAYISFEHSVNLAGGQPVSMDNMKEVYAYCAARGIPVLFDSTRAVENAYMIQRKDPRYRNTKVADILQEMMLYGDGCTISGKKDMLINIGGLLAFKSDTKWKRRCEDLLRVFEGSVADGGLAPGDLAAMARGMEEMVDDRYIHARVNQVHKLGRLLLDAGIPIVQPTGTHAVFLDAKRFLPHLDQDEFPAQRLAGEIYLETGVRAMERGNVSKGRDPKTGRNHRPSLELVRLTIPRRVYTADHMKAVAEGIIRLWERRDTIKGLKFVYEPPHLRFFQARFAPIE